MLSVEEQLRVINLPGTMQIVPLDGLKENSRGTPLNIKLGVDSNKS